MVTKVTKILHILYNVVHLLRTPLFPLQNNSGKAVTSVTGGFWLPFWLPVTRLPLLVPFGSMRLASKNLSLSRIY